MTGQQKKTDSQIQQDVLRELKWDTRVDETDVGVEVDNGIVTLTGTRGVTNRITVKASPISATKVRKAIEAALERQAAREAKRIALVVRDGRVIITGTVKTWAERQAIIGAARGTRGVRSVEDHLLHVVD